jgi:hypothetical protein
MSWEIGVEKDRVQRYAESLERTIQNNYHYLKETIDDFQEMCRMVTPGRNIPTGILTDIREMYKEMRTRLTEIRAVAQLLQGKYRQYYHRDSLRDKEIMEFGFIVKNCYSKFEYTVMQIEAMKRLREPSSKVDHQGQPFKWFSTKENQVTLIKNLRTLIELDYEPTREEVSEERRDLARRRSLTLFLFNGDSLSLDKLQSQIRLREHDIIERSGRDEIRGGLTHLRKVDPPEVEKMFQRLMESMGFTKLKCLLLSIHSQKDLKEEIRDLMKATLQGMKEGEVKTLSI